MVSRVYWQGFLSRIEGVLLDGTANLELETRTRVRAWNGCEKKIWTRRIVDQKKWFFSLPEGLLTVTDLLSPPGYQKETMWMKVNVGKEE